MNGRALDSRGRDLGWMEFWRRRPSPLGCNCVLARRRSWRLVAAARLVLRRMRLAVIAGMAAKALRLRPSDLGGQAVRWPRPEWCAIRDHLSGGRSLERDQWQGGVRRLGPGTGANIEGPRRRPAAFWRRSCWITASPCARGPARLDRAVPLSNPPMKRTKAVSSRPMFDEPGPRGSSEELAAAARPRQWYHRPTGTAFAAYRHNVRRTDARANNFAIAG